MARYLHRGMHAIRVARWGSGSLLVLATVATLILMAGGRAAATLHADRHPVAVRIGSAPADSKQKPGQNMCAPRLPWDAVRQQTAAGLHLTVAQVRARVLAGKPIQDVAAARHISLGRLHAIELHALEVGNERWIRLGCNTRQEGDAYMRIYGHMTVAQLNQEFTSLFVES